jgi:Fungal specific transcription factor domain
VKCDEGRPICKRCSSTGRVCDGYGVWGGGGNFYGNRQPQSIVSIVPTPVLNQEERRCLEWYHCRIKNKLPGIFVLRFWNTVLVQASVNEPAVLHAVLTLSSIHETGVIVYDDQYRRKSSYSLNEKEQFALQHYTKAIGHLRSHLSANDVHSALITCAIFVCLEVLQGRFRTAFLHLESGLKVLGETQQQSFVVDDSVLQVFSRLSIQLALLNQTHGHQHLSFSQSEYRYSCKIFYSFNEAWQGIEGILYRIFRLVDHSDQQHLGELVSPGLHSSLYEQQQEVIVDLKYWTIAYEASRTNLQGSFSQYFESFGCRLLYSYHNIAEIMAGTCLRSDDDESIFDSYNETFLIIISRLTTLARTRLSQASVPAGFSSYCFNMSRSVIDIGWLPALYYVAIKCRVHQIRLQAIKLLESSIHREGIWDAQISACVARKVMEIEEMDYYKDVHNSDDFPFSRSPNLQDLSLPPLPNCHRVHDVNVLLPNGPMDNIFLFYRRREDCGEWITAVKEYSILQQAWVDT